MRTIFKQEVLAAIPHMRRFGEMVDTGSFKDEAELAATCVDVVIAILRDADVARERVLTHQ